eukprot:m.486513 g.486513  ORF g.486513 m.486513 type:complete len:463 (+) comp57215_c0_seq13:1383-2771(+)
MPSQSDVLLHAMMPRFHAPHALCLIAVCPRVSGWCARKREMDTDPSQPSSSPTTEQAESVAPQYVVDFIICTPLAAFLRSVSQVATDGGQIIRLSTNSLEQQHLVQVVRDVIRLPDNVQICIRDSSLHSRRGKPELPSSGDPRPRPGVVRRFVYFICAARQNHTGPACDRYAEMGSAYCEAHDRAGRNCPYISARIQPSDFRQLLFVFPARERMLRRIDVISSTASTSKAVVTVQIMPDCYPLETYLYDIQLRVSFGYPRRDVIVGRPLIKRVWDNCQLLEVALPLELVRASWANKSVIKVIQEFMPLNGTGIPIKAPIESDIEWPIFSPYFAFGARPFPPEPVDLAPPASLHEQPALMPLQIQPERETRRPVGFQPPDAFSAVVTMMRAEVSSLRKGQRCAPIFLIHHLVVGSGRALSADSTTSTATVAQVATAAAHRECSPAHHPITLSFCASPAPETST